jgi:hypothetical protein
MTRRPGRGGPAAWRALAPAGAGTIGALLVAALLPVSVPGCAKRGASPKPSMLSVNAGFVPSPVGTRAIVIGPDGGTKLIDWRTGSQSRVRCPNLSAYGEWSRDGRYFVTKAHPMAGARMAIIDADQAKCFCADLPVECAWFLGWSPDGARVVLEDMGAERHDENLCAYDRRTGHLSVLAPGAAACGGDHYWGDDLLFRVLATTGGGWGSPRQDRYRYFVRSSQGGQCEILPRLFVQAVQPSRTGRYLAAFCLPEAAAEDDSIARRGYALYVLDNPRAPRARQLCPGRFVWWTLNWSPSDDRLAACLELPDSRGPYQMVTVHMATGRLSVLRHRDGQPVLGLDPTWGSDSNRIFYNTGTAPGKGAVWSYDTGSGSIRRVYAF